MHSAVKMTAFRKGLSALMLASLGTSASSAFAHGGEDPWGPPSLHLSTDQIEDLVAFGIGAKKTVIKRKECFVSSGILLNVRDEYAFDVDETVWLEADIPSSSPALSVVYDNYSGFGTVAFDPQNMGDRAANSGGEWRKVGIPLERARLANTLMRGSDLAVSASAKDGLPHEFTICSLSLRRSYTTEVPQAFGRVTVEVTDDKGQQTSARMGIYDSSGRLPMPSDDAVSLRRIGGLNRIVTLGAVPTWPVKNRTVFYADGQYHTRLPTGDYEIIVAKGPEYRTLRQRFSIAADSTKILKLTLIRWTDMAARSWYSGEDHIHYARTGAQDDRALGVFTRAEDLRVSNILQMGNIKTTYFNQSDWNKSTADSDAEYVVVPGQEDPRTSHRGHTIHLNIQGPLREPTRYLLYHEVFDKVHAQGGLVGYAHVWDPDTRMPEELKKSEGFKWAMRGMALDVPFGLVDFAEIMTGYMAGSATWFDFLNLGYKLTPSAGTDYPYIDIPGAARNYVRIDGPFTPQNWFNGLKKGQAFVTSGPILELSINDQNIGSEIRLKKGDLLRIRGKVTLNPDVDRLSSLELVEQGEVARTVLPEHGSNAAEILIDFAAKHGTWFVLRARGNNPNTIALSAPIYVVVDGQSWWKRSEVPSIVAKMRAMMQELLIKPSMPDATESWETAELLEKYWDTQQCFLAERVDQANAIYDDLVMRATKLPGPDSEKRDVAAMGSRRHGRCEEAASSSGRSETP